MTATTTEQGVISTIEELRAILGWPKDSSVAKELTRLDRFSQYFIKHSPFVLLSTANRAGKCDVSPKGDQPGFAKVLDDFTLLIPDRPGNRRADTFLNVLENPHAGTIFLIPEVEETLRVNGKAKITTDRMLLDQCEVAGKTPTLGFLIEVEEVYFHCAKAFKRSNLWNPAAWQGRGELPSLGVIMAEQLKIEDMSGEEMNCEIEEAYVKNLY